MILRNTQLMNGAVKTGSQIAEAPVPYAITLSYQLDYLFRVPKTKGRPPSRQTKLLTQTGIYRLTPFILARH